MRIRLGLLLSGRPRAHVGDLGVRNGVPRARGTAADLDPVDFDEAVLQQPGHRRAGLAVVQWPVVTDLSVKGPVEVVTVAGARTPGALGVCD